MSRKDIAGKLIVEQGELYSEAMGIDLARGTPEPLFHWLLGALLLSARIPAGNVVRAVRGLKQEKLHTVKGILASSRDERIRVLNENGYARFDNRGADQIHAAAELVDARYRGDLRKLRDAGGDADGIAGRLTEVKGIGPTGASIFCREAQLVWDPLYPRLDGPAADAARDLGLPADAGSLAELAGSRERLVRLAAALTRAALEGPAEAVKAAG